MSYIFPPHRYRMQYGSRRIYAEDVRAIPFVPQPVYNPQQPYPYFVEKLRQEQGPRITESPHATRFIPDIPTFIPNEAFNSLTYWKDNMRNKRPWVTEVESPYRGWPRMTKEHGITV